MFISIGSLLLSVEELGILSEVEEGSVLHGLHGVVHVHFRVQALLLNRLLDVPEHVVWQLIEKSVFH